jgi:tetratricopeptide (TPR) repeat protein
LAGLLRRAEPQFQTRLNESGAFGRIERTRQRRLAVSWALSVSAAAAVVALVSVGALSLRAENDAVVLDPEPVRATEKRVPPSVTSEAIMVPPEPAPVPAPPPARASTEPRGEAACRKLSSQAKYDGAVECFRGLSRGNGVQNEVALYEAARLTTEHLGDAPGALALLDEHKQRFPRGALRGEMDWLRVRNLERAGRYDEAFAASEALLASPVGRKLAPDLHWLRGKMFEDARGDCGRAASEFVSLVGVSGSQADEAEFRRARCLEKLGRSSDAAAAYEQYLQRLNPARANDARTRLSALR